ncbi:GW dipeptide domain-containing protein [Staphylococcus sp. IVB6218]|uniref:GW dipeptide domain-containing protein n=1 Tax=Staphylococcus sp. IVB6218 TaxID=2989767 RepID=UPI0021D1BFC6|nr:GW dipeptide domain-containing protein [Staphylococcus sp. IVB6218]UXR81040.1 GW dipeptide domain-containing protein [Staphylococcus sp. IVB6218]
MAKKFGYKTPSMIALTIAGTAMTAHHADAAETTATQQEPVNVLNDETAKQQGEVAKQETTENNNQIAGTQTYSDPAKVQLNSDVNNEATDVETQQSVQPSEVSQEATTDASTELTSEEAPIDEQDIAIHSEAEDNTSSDSTYATATPYLAQSNESANQNVDNTTSQNDQTVNETEVLNANAPTPPRVGGKGSSATTPDTATTFRAAVASPQMSQPTYKPKVNSAINTYIRNQNYTVPKYEEDYSSHIPRYGYRGGVGKPEGIVIHDTANDSSTIDGEIAYMKRNANSAFVHGFVDGNRIVETQPTDYLAYGAGYAANQRFIHMELVHVHDYDSFARQMNNMADYVATNLQYYGLTPNSAEEDGRGTVWTHLAVTRHLGGTDHVDPHGYLHAHGYSYNELYDLIQEKYQTKMGITRPVGSSTVSKPVAKKPTATKPVVTTKPSTTTKPTTNTVAKPTTPKTTTASQNHLTVANDLGYGRINTANKGLYATVYDQKGLQTNKTNQTLKVTKTANLNGKQFYLVTDAKSNALIGWVNKGDVQYQKAQAEQSLRKNYTLKPGTTVYSVPWGTNAQVQGQTSKATAQTFATQKQQKIGNTQWLYGTVNKLTGWVNSNNIIATPVKKPVVKPTATQPAVAKPITKVVVKQPTTKTMTKTPVKTNVISPLKVTSDSGMGRINTNNNGLRATVYDKNGIKTTATERTMRVSKKASLNGQNYYLVTDYLSGTHIGWVKQQDVNYRQSEYAQVINKNYTIDAGTKLYAAPWGSSNQVVGTVTGKNGQAFKAVRQQKVANTVYLYGTTDRLAGWVAQSALSLPKATSNVTSHVSRIGRLNVNNHGLKATVYDKTGKNADRFADKTYKITKTATANNQNYVLLQNTNGKTPLGWVNAKDVFSQSLGSTKPVKATYTVNNNTSGLYSMPWGTSKQRIDSLKQLANRTFNATKTVAVGNDTFVYGNVNRKTGWINQLDLTPVKNSPKKTSVVSAVKPYNTVATRAVTKPANEPANEPALTQTLNDSNHYFINNNYGFYYNNAGDRTAAGQLSKYYENVFKVNKSAIVNGITWYYGTFQDGKKGWVKASDLRSQLVKQYKSAYTLNQAVNKQYSLMPKPQIQRVAGTWEDATVSETRRAMDTERIAKDAREKYQFLKLDQFQGLEASDLDKLLKNKGILHGQGQAFREAAITHNINEIYLISHALLETGHGTSQLSNGGYVNNQNQVVTNPSKKYYNMFGIGAFDHDAVRNGFKTAQNNGWDTVRKSIVGGAEFIKERYIGAGQNTLYRMRWNPHNPGVHQYATDITWASHNANRMKDYYDLIGQVGKYFDIDMYQK